MMRIAISGCCGRMGKLIGQAVCDNPHTQLTGAFEVPGHPDCGKDFGVMLGVGECRVLVTDNHEKVGESSDCLIDFTSPKATLAHLNVARAQKIAMVIGTTGFDAAGITAIKEAATEIPLVFSPNMSVGVNVLFAITREVTKRLGDRYDIEIIEAHHRMKKDAPSGTACRLADIIAETRKQDMDAVGCYGRQGMVGARPSGEIGIHAVRGGDIVGEHTVMFAGQGERIELVHRAHSRMTFARGAVQAALFVTEKNPGVYSMYDVLFS